MNEAAIQVSRQLLEGIWKASQDGSLERIMDANGVLYVRDFSPNPPYNEPWATLSLLSEKVVKLRVCESDSDEVFLGRIELLNESAPVVIWEDGDRWVFVAKTSEKEQESAIRIQKSFKNQIKLYWIYICY